MSELLVPDVSNITATAILGWYAWHTASKTIPQLLAAFRQELAETRGECQGEREVWREEFAAERRQRREDHLAIVDALNDLSRRR